MPYGEALERQTHFLKMALEPKNMRVFGGDEFRLQHASIALKYGTPYFWDREICDLIKPAIESLRDPWTLVRESVPAPQGFFWFEKPPSHSKFEYTEGNVLLRGFSWCIYYLTPGKPAKFPGGLIVPVLHPGLPPSGGGSIEKAGGVAITFYSEHNGRVRPWGDSMWRFGRTHMELAEVEREESGSPLDAFDLGGRDSAAVVTCWQFIQQHILAPSPGMRVDRATARRVERLGAVLDPLVSVIRLRRREYVDYELPDEDSGRRVSVRFLAGGMNGGYWQKVYKEELGYPIEDKRGWQPKWILPNWRGPQYAPIKVGHIKVGLVDT